MCNDVKTFEGLRAPLSTETTRSEVNFVEEEIKQLTTVAQTSHGNHYGYTAAEAADQTVSELTPGLDIVTRSEDQITRIPHIPHIDWWQLKLVGHPGLTYLAWEKGYD